ncbi:hypothetical protein [Bradyrhizobium sp. USDA 4538]|nr:hypothetical protein [Bradyrhizobium sp. USDA 4538]
MSVSMPEHLGHTAWRSVNEQKYDFECRVTEMIGETLAPMRPHRNRIHRYRRFLETPIVGLQREDVERRLSEEALRHGCARFGYVVVRFEYAGRIGSSDPNLSGVALKRSNRAGVHLP